ncbi:hypothetical protein [Arachidicoccus sp.]|uniref:hypothetical protein n=1 Tax=Arachidicoccus sp. TaxID=1872624 RepID=UPI003D1BE2D3
MKQLLFISFICIWVTSCAQKPCNKLPSHFTSYKEAIHDVEAATFNFSEGLNTSKSGWIENAHYYIAVTGIKDFL